MDKQPTRILILGGGFGGVFTARRLETLYAGRGDVEITLVSRDNFLLMTPLMFEACTGTLEFRHCSVAIREFLKRVRFVEASVSEIDLDRRIVRATAGEGKPYELGYDQLVLALGAGTNMKMIKGSKFAFTFKTLADVMALRNHLIERLERADAETDPVARKQLLSLAVIGGGLVGTEVFGELTAFMGEILRYYPRIQRSEIEMHLIQAVERIMPEVPQGLADYAVRVLGGRKGVFIRCNAEVQAIEPGKVHLKEDTIEAGTIVLAAGIVPSHVLGALALEKDKHGHVLVDAAMQVRGRPGVWAIGDCASIPDPQGKPYPKLAQHAMREAKVLAENIKAVLDGKSPRPFEYRMMGIMAAIGKHKGLGTVLGIPMHGFFAWWVRRTYYLMVMPRWAQRVRIVADWTIALFFRPDITKVDLAREAAMLERTGAAGMDLTETTRV